MDPVVIIFVVLALCLILGIPVAFCIGLSAISFLLYQGYPSPMVMVQRMVDGAKSYTMMALPMFIFAGALMAYGSTPRLMKLANMLVSRVPGGLGAATLVTCGFFGAVSGSGVASTAAIGGIGLTDNLFIGERKTFSTMRADQEERLSGAATLLVEGHMAVAAGT